MTALPPAESRGKISRECENTIYRTRSDYPSVFISVVNVIYFIKGVPIVPIVRGRGDEAMTRPHIGDAVSPGERGREAPWTGMAGSGELYQSPRAEDEEDDEVGCPFRAFENGVELSPQSKHDTQASRPSAASGGQAGGVGERVPGDVARPPARPLSRPTTSSEARPMTASTAGKLAQRVRDLECTVAGLERELAVRMGTVMKLSAAERAQRERADALEAELIRLRGEGGRAGGSVGTLDGALGASAAAVYGETHVCAKHASSSNAYPAFAPGSPAAARAGTTVRPGTSSRPGSARPGSARPGSARPGTSSLNRYAPLPPTGPNDGR